MKILVIGGCGFIGSHVVDKCLSEGMSVRVLDRTAELSHAPRPGVEYVHGDLSDLNRMMGLLQGIDAVVHLAGTTVPSTSNLDPSADISGNLIPAVRLLEAMRVAEVRQLVFFSSGGTVYGVPGCSPVPESHPLNPICSYGIVKVAIEKYLHMEHQLHGLQYVCLRPANVYGPRQGKVGVQGVINTYLRNLADGNPIEVWGDGRIVRDYLYVKDVADLCHLALISGRTGCFNAGSGQGASIADVLGMIGTATGRSLSPVYRPGRGFDVPEIVLDVSRAKAEFGWSAQVGLCQGIEETWEWILNKAGHVPG